MSIVAAVKQAVEEGHDFWALNLPEQMKDAYYSGYKERRREDKDEFTDYLLMKASARALKEEGIRGLCF
jgi:hypothetical protein